jgi:uncharacterized protein (TIGR03067 family)
MVRLAFLVLVPLATAAPAVAAPAPFAKPERRTDLEKLRGEWQVISEKRCYLLMAPRGGKLAWVTFSCESKAVSVTGDRLQWHCEGVVTGREVVRLGKGVLPPIDLTNEQSGRTRRGIYTLTGGVLTLRVSAGGAGRPKSFTADVENEITYVLRRTR